MFVVVTRMTASVGAAMIGSGTSSTRTSRVPCQVTAFMGLRFIGTTHRRIVPVLVPGPHQGKRSGPAAGARRRACEVVGGSGVLHQTAAVPIRPLRVTMA